ncbi:MAG: TetR/AcrR family transcriptional regulator [Terriglobales bacterium]|jgi:TetR/AcrR family transcriptional repressor of nem operon
MKNVPDTRTRLVEVAMDLIWPRSYGAVSVDMICKAAGVFKGSFYHFFPTKADLMAAALEHYWSTNQPQFDRIFSPAAPPLEQIRKYFQYVRKRQIERRSIAGRVLGCPYASIGCEISQQEPAVGAKIRELVSRYCAYFERAIRAANDDGVIQVADPKAKARELFALLEGTLTQARIHDDPSLLDGMADRAVGIVKMPSRAAA